MTQTQFRMIGLQKFDRVAEKLYQLLEQAFGYKDEYFQQAVEEAVCNAARYSIYGPEKADITIIVRITAADVSVTVISPTHKFDAITYQLKLMKLLDSKYKDMEWGDYVGLKLDSSGFWYMLTGVDYLLIDSEGQSITLSKTVKSHNPELPVTTKISCLVPRFLVRQNGVIL